MLLFSCFSHYKNSKYLKNKETLVQLHFLKSVCIVFTRFLKLFQKVEPLIHLLYNECHQLLLIMMRRFLKLEVIEGKAGESLVEIDFELATNQLVEIDIGTNTKKALKGVAVEKHKIILLCMKNFFMSSTQYLQSRLPLNNSVTKHCRCLHPQNRQHHWNTSCFV